MTQTNTHTQTGSDGLVSTCPPCHYPGGDGGEQRENERERDGGGGRRGGERKEGENGRDGQKKKRETERAESSV